MELTKEQIQQIDTYISACGIKYYDVRAEIVDHFASILEKRLEETPNLDFKKAIEEEHKKFSHNGFKKLLETKIKTTHNRFLKLTFQNLKSFFKLPKIIVSVFLFFALYQLMYLFENIEVFFITLTALGFLLIVQLGIRMYLNYKQKREIFLVLNRTLLFFQIVNNIILLFNLILSIRSEKSYLNTIYNNIHLAVFVLILLIYWSMEHVYYQNRKKVQEQYPTVIV